MIDDVNNEGYYSFSKLMRDAKVWFTISERGIGKATFDSVNAEGAQDVR